MPQANRPGQVMRGLSLTFTLLTWVTIAPAVTIGLIVTALFAWFVLKIDHTDLLITALFGGVVLLICSVPGQFLWWRTFRHQRN